MKTTLGLPPEIWSLRIKLGEELGWEPLHAYAAMGGVWNTAAIEMHDATATEDQLMRWAGVAKKDGARFVQALLKIEFVTRLEDGRFEIMLVAKAFGITKARRMGAQITNEKRWATRSNVAPPIAERVAERHGERSTSDKLSDTQSDALSDALSETASWGVKGGKLVLSYQPQENKSNSELSEQSGSSESPASLSVEKCNSGTSGRARDSKPRARSRREVSRIAQNAVSELAPRLTGARDPHEGGSMSTTVYALLLASPRTFGQLRRDWHARLVRGEFETALRKELKQDFIAAIESGRVTLPDVPDPPIPAKSRRNVDLNPTEETNGTRDT